jgi:hypothetical protein
MIFFGVDPAAAAGRGRKRKKDRFCETAAGPISSASMNGSLRIHLRRREIERSVPTS